MRRLAEGAAELAREVRPRQAGRGGQVADVCFSVGLQSVGSFTSSFTRTYGVSPTAYRAAYPPAAHNALVPACVVRAYSRPQRSTFREDSVAVRG